MTAGTVNGREDGLLDIDRTVDRNNEGSLTFDGIDDDIDDGLLD